jgi:acid phosphatase class B
MIKCLKAKELNKLNGPIGFGDVDVDINPAKKCGWNQ